MNGTRDIAAGAGPRMDPGAPALGSEAEAAVDGYSVGHADALCAEAAVRRRVELALAAWPDPAAEREALARCDREAARAAPWAAASRGVPAGLRLAWCDAYARGAAEAHARVAAARRALD